MEVRFLRRYSFGECDCQLVAKNNTSVVNCVKHAGNGLSLNRSVFRKVKNRTCHTARKTLSSKFLYACNYIQKYLAIIQYIGFGIRLNI